MILRKGKFADALFSDEKEPLYRYLLAPHPWSDGWTMAVLLHNPSTADHDRSDPTITRMIGFAKREGAGSLLVVNVMAYRATDPKKVRKAEDPVGPENIRYILIASSEAKVFVVAWGAIHWSLRERALPGIKAAVGRKGGVVCLGKTKFGDPRHPLYLSRQTKLVPWS